MKNLTLIEAEDISKLTKMVGYFFEGDDGFLKRNGIAQYSFYLKDHPEHLIKLGELLDKESGAEDMYQLKKYICSELDKHRKSLIEYQNRIDSSIAEINRKKDVLELITDCKTLKEAIFLLLKDQNNENTESHI